ncbi:hypothetical protein [Pararhizobium sp.]|uniref:hypothetical protein n=1 Tax=Pararhizobium sp. TaxID=1977563 RepID=UPI003D145EAE
MKNAASKPEYLRDALASLPEPLDLQDLVLPNNRRHNKEDLLKEALEEPFPANAPLSLQPIR